MKSTSDALSTSAQLMRTGMRDKENRKSAKRPRLHCLLHLNCALIFLFTGLLALIIGIGGLGIKTSLEKALDLFRGVEQESDWVGHREEVKDAFITSWDAYAKYAWGTQEPICHEMWEGTSIIGDPETPGQLNQALRPAIHPELPEEISGPLSPKMDHLVCFLPGAIAFGATEALTETEARLIPSWNSRKEQQMQLAWELTRTCWAMYAFTESGLSPEIVWFEAGDQGSSPSQSSGDDEDCWKRDLIIKPLDAHNLQLPETVESLFLMYRVTNDSIYRKWGWEIFKAFQKHTRVGDGEGYTSLQDVTKVSTPQRDDMEGFWLAETLKYLYLLFSPKEFLPLSDVVFNTEAHVLPRFNQSRFRTGWKRVKRS
ncbi:glycoside hydrolase [Aspergillus varians]